ncbi:hypothetical protein FLBR109950_07015 [Flavobacterium branchiophilum]|uniref:Uncharacterized protein n=1 Tax=Flavobacterium branchiophilum (strain FL-15) TaxID=1034807 RepID=G2Z4N3_FLABF|nr:Hypothetical protein FBFL15_0386 [Flavobacterium branchiophilum FL-15]
MKKLQDFLLGIVINIFLLFFIMIISTFVSKLISFYCDDCKLMIQEKVVSFFLSLYIVYIIIKIKRHLKRINKY